MKNIRFQGISKISDVKNSTPLQIIDCEKSNDSND